MEYPLKWLDPTLSLSMELQQEQDRRAAVRLTHHELQELADGLIVHWYRHQTLLEQCLKQVQILELQLLIARAEPADEDFDDWHLEMARELLGEDSADH